MERGIQKQEIEKISKELLGKSSRTLFMELENYTDSLFEEIKSNLLNIGINKNEKIFTCMILADENDKYKYMETFFDVVKDETNLDENIENIYLEDVFLNLKYSELEEIKEMTFDGWIKIEENEYLIKVSLEYDERYFEKIKEYYSVFNLNGKRWETLNLALIKRAFRVKLLEYDFEMNKNILRNIIEKKYELNYYFEEYEEKILRNKSIMWNIEEKKILSSIFVRPTQKSMSYEYILNYKDDENILVKNNENSILFTFVKDENKLSIISKKEKEEIWDIYSVKKVDKIMKTLDSNTICFNNYYENSFLDELIEKYSKADTMRTESDLRKRFERYDFIKDRMSIAYVMVNKDEKDKMFIYDCNEFMEQDFYRINKSNKLNIFIKVKDIKFNDEYIEDYFSFIISSIQKDYYEYEVKGYLYE